MVVLTFLGTLDTDLPLPQQPPGPFELSDSMTVREMLSGTAAPYLECLTRDAHARREQIPAFGWAQVGACYERCTSWCEVLVS